MSAATAGCGDGGGGRPSAESQPRDEEITATIDAVWEAVGVTTEQVTVGGYGYRFLDVTICADLPTDDRWYGFRGTHLLTGTTTPGDLRVDLPQHLEADGFSVERYRSRVQPERGVAAFRAGQGEVVVIGYFDGAGGASFSVRSGPCAPASGSFEGDDVYELIDS